MSKQIASWIDEVMAESNTPSDDFTWTDGSNYGLDGFYHTQTMGEGIKDQARLPSVHGLSDLPEGFVTAGDEPFDIDGRSVDSGAADLSFLLSEEEGARPLSAAQKQAAALADLAWLDPTQEQDPDRLPKELRPDQPPLNAIPELEEAWGVERRTDGLNIIPNKDREIAQYEESIRSDLPATPGVEKNAVADSVRRALRRATYGHNPRDIFAELHQMLGQGSPRAKHACKLVMADYGLAGKVFIRASAFPGLSDGYHVETIKKLARTAQYVITDNPKVARVLGLEMVSEVPWRKALRHYGPKLKAANYRIASEGSPKEILRKAFLSGPTKMTMPAGHKPVDVRPADRVSAQEARQVFDAAPKQKQQVVRVDRLVGARRKARVRIAQYVQANQLSEQEALRLGQSKADPKDILAVAATLVQANRVQEAKYEGTGTLVPTQKVAGHEEAWSALRLAEKAVDLESRKFEAASLEKAKSHIAKMVQNGILTRKEALYAVKSGKTAAQVMELATTIVQQAGQHRRAVMVAQEAKEFSGPLLTAALQQTAPQKQLPKNERLMMAAAKASGIKLAEFRHLATWLRRQMTEGVMGDELTALLTVRYASPVREAAADLIRELRAMHEGLSGVMYVDTEAYASPSGSAGCEEHAAKHRTNQVKFAKAMSRCASCTALNANGVCTKYGKPLLHKIPKNARQIQEQSLRSANAKDFENTAALFDPGEYNLTSPLDSISLDTAPGVGILGEVLFGGGMNLED